SVMLSFFFANVALDIIICLSPFPAEIHNSCIFLHMSPKSLRANFNVPKMVLLEEKSPPLPRCHN
ncbi:MAG: hypothetical protein ACLTV3_12185, partial [Faecalibacterium prausnitzii]